MRLYHGSNMVIEHPDLARCKPYKDFGKGFYLSADKEQALALAKTESSRDSRGWTYLEYLFF